MGSNIAACEAFSVLPALSLANNSTLCYIKHISPEILYLLMSPLSLYCGSGTHPLLFYVAALQPFLTYAQRCLDFPSHPEYNSSSGFSLFISLSSRTCHRGRPWLPSLIALLSCQGLPPCCRGSLSSPFCLCSNAAGCHTSRHSQFNPSLSQLSPYIIEIYY